MSTVLTGLPKYDMLDSDGEGVFSMAADLINEGFSDDLEEKLFRLRAGEPLRVLDLFSRCGGMSLGLKRAEYPILGGVEINQQAVNTYARNLFKGVDEKTFELHEGISPENSMSEGTKKASKNLLPNHLVGRAERDGARCLLRH